MLKSRVLLFMLLASSLTDPGCYVPVNGHNRRSAAGLQLTEIGAFGLLRKARKEVPAHYHSGIDIKRPGKNYENEPVFPIMKGVVISKRADGPFAQLILEHDLNGKKLWTVYEHVAGITVGLHETVDPNNPVARFMNKEELNRYGWQFDHLHFEVLKFPPPKLKPSISHPERHRSSYTLVCFTEEDLKKYFYDPLVFLKDVL